MKPNSKSWSLKTLTEKPKPKLMDFHVFYTTLQDGKLVNTGVNIEAYSMLEAIEKFNEQYDIEPIYTVNKGSIC